MGQNNARICLEVCKYYKVQGFEYHSQHHTGILLDQNMPYDTAY